MLRSIRDVAGDLGIGPDRLIPYGSDKVKVKPEVVAEAWAQDPKAIYVVVTALTPTLLGEGKTLCSIGLAMALCRVGRKAAVCLRQPSLGPVFGLKGGAVGGGAATVEPSDDINLHFTGDFHAVELANNLLSTFLDNHLFHGNKLDIDPSAITWRRVTQLSDRNLRRIITGLAGEGGARETGFDIAPASEVMAVLAQARDAVDLRDRLARMVVAYRRNGEPITAGDVRCAGAMAAILRDAWLPNIVQTCEGTPAIIHTGPFANIAHGNSSIVADRVAAMGADAVVTESGFGADMGFEKFCNIKCRSSGMVPDVAVLVASVRALKVHSGKFRIRPGRPPDPRIEEEDPETVAAGAENLRKQIENVHLHGLPCVVCINRFPQDHDSELRVIEEAARAAGAQGVAVVEFFGQGGAGGEDLARQVIAAAGGGKFRFLYPLDAPIAEKIEMIATRVYGAATVEYSPLARRRIRRAEEMGWANLPVCMAKTQLSLSDDPARVGRPRDFTLHVRDMRLATGAGFLYPLTDVLTTLPGLPSRPRGERIDLLPDGSIVWP